MVEKLEHERNAVGKDEMLTHVLKLVDVVDFEVFEEEQEGGRDGLHDDLLVPIDINRNLKKKRQ